MLKVMDIFKCLPAAQKKEGANCGVCGFSTCMMFATKLQKKEVDIEKCPHASCELKEKIKEANRVQQLEITFDGLKIGGETVMFRHEKTFINPCPFFVKLDRLGEDFERVKALEIEYIGNKYKIDGIYLENPTDEERKIVAEAGFVLMSASDMTLFNLVSEGAISEMVKKLTFIREKAILECDINYSAPVLVHLKEQEPFALCAKGSAAICKYASVLLFDYPRDSSWEAVFSALIALRLNIYTDPEKPLQVESKVYEFNSPDERALVFLTTNFALTYFAVANELSSLKAGSYLVVTPSEGMSVLTAWSAEKITAEIASRVVSSSHILDKIKNKRLVIPGLLGDLKDDLQASLSDWEIIVGTSEAYKIPDLVKNLTT
ncbi:acetyl-CoA decarbonylase/synthase complex subunit gamma [Candidatus Gastranaerophilus sp. (ex Termes propinquus)]|nr:acetyl-CoA decarbonylase/synthase complex subunit gamma [Candidatus Gastranaerophilus sp. (ex Termes propinquus)]